MLHLTLCPTLPFSLLGRMLLVLLCQELLIWLKSLPIIPWCCAQCKKKCTPVLYDGTNVPPFFSVFLKGMVDLKCNKMYSLVVILYMEMKIINKLATMIDRSFLGYYSYTRTIVIPRFMSCFFACTLPYFFYFVLLARENPFQLLLIQR